MTAGQITALIFGNLVTVLVAVVGSSGYWSFKQRKLEREYEKEDKGDRSVEDFEKSLEAVIKAGIVTMAYILMPWQERIMSRPEPLMGVEEHDSLEDLYKAYKALGGNSTVERRQEYIIENYQIVPDEDIERIEKEGADLK